MIIINLKHKFVIYLKYLKVKNTWNQRILHAKDALYLTGEGLQLEEAAQSAFCLLQQQIGLGC